ncbi:MAG: ABC transporter permease [Bacillota bacterium]
MNIMENVRLAIEGLRANKMRALLTMLGIIIGIGSVIAILTVGNGMSGVITDTMNSFGGSNIGISLRERDQETLPGMGFSRVYSGTDAPDADNLITDDMIDNMLQHYPDEIAHYSLTEFAGSGQARDGNKYANISLAGVNDAFLTVNNVDLLRGRAISKQDVDGMRSTAVVSDKLVNNMFGGNMDKALGQELQVTLNGDIYTFSIVGVYEYEQSGMGGSTASEKDISTALYVPISVAKRMTGSDPGYQSLVVMVNGGVDSKAFAKQLETFYNRFYINNEEFECSATSMESVIDQINTVMGTINTALSVIAGISLLVGGIGVMNIMLVSVTERTREIGTRKALGATNANIRIQFIVESTIICLIGGFFGVLLGGGLGYVGSSLIGSATGPDVGSIVLAVGFSMGIGVFFGYYPANKAAKLDPIEALRYE